MTRPVSVPLLRRFVELIDCVQEAFLHGNFADALSLAGYVGKPRYKKFRVSIAYAEFLINRFDVAYLTSSKTTLTDYQCVSTGCCIHVAKTEITIDNQLVTKSLQRYRFLPKQPKENTEKNNKLVIFLFGLTIHMMLDGIISTISWRILWNYNVLAS